MPSNGGYDITQAWLAGGWLVAAATGPDFRASLLVLWLQLLGSSFGTGLTELNKHGQANISLLFFIVLP